MLIPVGEDVAVPITVVVLGSEPEVLRGTLRRLEPDNLHLEIPGRSIGSGVRVIVTAGDRVKLPGRVLRGSEGAWVVSRDDARPSDDRAAPRFSAVLDVRWRVASPPQERWVAGGPDPGPFSTFSGPADLSLSGMRFDCDALVPPVGARLLLEIGFDGGQECHRALGVVRRLDPVDARTRIGVEFVELPESTFDALSDHTLRHM